MVQTTHDKDYQQCSLTVMDNIADPDIRFDDQGVCNYYYQYQEAAKKELFSPEESKIKFDALIQSIKEQGKGKPYDCLIGLSGGVDSSYTALIVKQAGLRPLAVHLDNGWDSELAVKNVENIVNRLHIDLHSLVVNWQEFRDIQLAYLRASVVDIEVVSDHAIFASLYKLAREKKIGYIISGTNIVTEQIMPPSWLYHKLDFANLRDIHDTYGKLKRKTYPYLDFSRYVYYSGILNIRSVSILNYLPYNKKEAKQAIASELGWRDYGGKHYESLFTKFYQAYILPQKFKIDKRKPHLSTLICSGQMSREEALLELEWPLYSAEALRQDKAYVLKKLGLDEQSFEHIMQLPVQPHSAFKTDEGLKKGYMQILEKTVGLRRILKPKQK